MKSRSLKVCILDRVEKKAALIKDFPDMCNFLGVLHGACSTYLADTYAQIYHWVAV
jgi:hypothetical protein